jgi:hypothetical protein
MAALIPAQSLVKTAIVFILPLMGRL